MSVFTNKRKYVRIPAKGVAAYLHLDGHRRGCNVENISAGGLFLLTDRFFPVGTQLSFDLVRKDTRQTLTVSGRVVGVITAELAAKTRLPQGVRVQFGRQKVAEANGLHALLRSLRRTSGPKPPAGLELTRLDEAALLEAIGPPDFDARTRRVAPEPTDAGDLALLRRKIAKLEAELAERDEQLALARRLLKTHGLDKG